VRARLTLFWRLMIKPLAREPVRTALTILAVALRCRGRSRHRPRCNARPALSILA